MPLPLLLVSPLQVHPELCGPSATPELSDWASVEGDGDGSVSHAVHYASCVGHTGRWAPAAAKPASKILLPEKAKPHGQSARR